MDDDAFQEECAIALRKGVEVLTGPPDEYGNLRSIKAH